MAKFLVSVEARYAVEANNEQEATAFAIAAAACCGIEAPGIADKVELQGADPVCCTQE